MSKIILILLAVICFINCNQKKQIKNNSKLMIPNLSAHFFLFKTNEYIRAETVFNESVLHEDYEQIKEIALELYRRSEQDYNEAVTNTLFLDFLAYNTHPGITGKFISMFKEKAIAVLSFFLNTSNFEWKESEIKLNMLKTYFLKSKANFLFPFSWFLDYNYHFSSNISPVLFGNEFNKIYYDLLSSRDRQMYMDFILFRNKQFLGIVKRIDTTNSNKYDLMLLEGIEKSEDGEVLVFCKL